MLFLSRVHLEVGGWGRWGGVKHDLIRSLTPTRISRTSTPARHSPVSQGERAAEEMQAQMRVN